MNVTSKFCIVRLGTRRDIILDVQILSARGSSQAFDQTVQFLKRHFAVGIQSHNDFYPNHS